MNKDLKEKPGKTALAKEEPKKTTALGRRRDDTLDTRIIEAAIDILAEVGFDSMTMDTVAARAKAGKAAVYRRWSSKAELVRDALIRMSRNSVDFDALPDTGTLRGDLLALMKPYSKEYGERKMRVLAKLGSFFTEHRKLAEEATAGIFGPWTDINRKLMQRAVERDEIPVGADIELACEVIISMNAYRTLTQNKTFNDCTYTDLLDNILLPALKNRSNK